MTHPSDLNDTQWRIIELFLPPEKSVGNPCEVDLCAVVNAIFYRADNGIKGRAMPIDFPPWQMVYTY
jgi:transposase